MDLKDELLSVWCSLEEYGVDPALLNYAHSRGLLTTAGLTPSLEDVRGSLFDRLKNKVEDTYTNVAAKWRRHKERKERKGVSDEGVVYPKTTPSEVIEFTTAGNELINILTKVLSGFNPTVVSTSKGLDAYQVSITDAFRKVRGILGIPDLSFEKQRGVFRSFGKPHVAIDEWAKRDIGESVNGWTLPNLNSERASISDQIEKILYLMKRIVGRVNSLSFDSMDEHPALLKAVDTVQFSLRVVRVLFNQWVGDLTRVHLYSLS